MAAYDEYLNGDGPAVWYEAGYRKVIEDHLHLLLSNPASRVVTIVPSEAARYDGDFYGIISSLKLPLHMVYPIMRMNQMTGPEDYRASMTTLIIPEPNELEKLRSQYNTVQNMV